MSTGVVNMNRGSNQGNLMFIMFIEQDLHQSVPGMGQQRWSREWPEGTDKHVCLFPLNGPYVDRSSLFLSHVQQGIQRRSSVAKTCGVQFWGVWHCSFVTHFPNTQLAINVCIWMFRVSKQKWIVGETPATGHSATSVLMVWFGIIWYHLERELARVDCSLPLDMPTCSCWATPFQVDLLSSPPFVNQSIPYSPR